MKKVIILISLLFIVTGCSASYELSIDNKNVVNEKISLIENNDVVLKYGESIKDASKKLSTYFFEENEITSFLKVPNYDKIPAKNDSTETYISLNNTFNSLDEYNKSFFLYNFFEKGEMVSDNNNYTLFANNFKYDTLEKITNNGKFNFDFNTLNIKITLPYVVSYSNADIVYNDSNTYIWIVNKNNYQKKNIKLTFSGKKVSSKEESNILDKIGGNLITNITSGKVDGEKYMKENKVIVLLIIGIVLIAIVATIFILRRKFTKNNNV